MSCRPFRDSAITIASIHQPLARLKDCFVVSTAVHHRDVPWWMPCSSASRGMSSRGRLSRGGRAPAPSCPSASEDGRRRRQDALVDVAGSTMPPSRHHAVSEGDGAVRPGEEYSSARGRCGAPAPSSRAPTLPSGTKTTGRPAESWGFCGDGRVLDRGDRWRLSAPTITRSARRFRATSRIFLPARLPHQGSTTTDVVPLRGESERQANLTFEVGDHVRVGLEEVASARRPSR